MRIDQLRTLVAEHETFWAALAQQNPGDHLLGRFIRHGWDPFFSAYIEAGEVLDVDRVAHELGELRKNAAALEIPVPELAPAERVEMRVAGVAGVVDLDAASAAAINDETDRRFWATTNYKPGRKLDPRIADDRDMLPEWHSIHNAVAASYRLVSETGGQTHAPGDGVVARIDHETDEMFWRATGYKVGRKLDRHDPADMAMVPEWLSIRYAVAQEVARDALDHAGPAGTQVAVQGRGGRGGGGRRAYGNRRGVAYGPVYDVPVDDVIEYPSQEAQEDDDMNTTDPWRTMQSSPPALEMTLPAVKVGCAPVKVGCAPVKVGCAPVTVGLRPRGVYGDHHRWYMARPGLVADLAPALAPATGGAQVTLELDAQNVLHASICVDGVCHRSAVDLAGPIAAVLARIAAYHGDLRADAAAAGADTQAPGVGAALLVGSEVHAQGTVDDVVKSAGVLLVGSMMDAHTQTACAGWFHNLEKAASGALHGVEHAAAGTLKQLAPLIAPAAAMAAGAVGGPAAAALASSLVGAATGNGGAKQVVAAAEQLAATNPEAAQVLADAKSVVARTTAAYHIAKTVSSATSGNRAAQQQLQQAAQAAAQGDPAAQQVLAIADKTLGGDGQGAPAQASDPGAQPVQADDGSGAQGSADDGSAPAVQGWYQIVGAIRSGWGWSDMIPGVAAYDAAKGLAGGGEHRHKHHKHHHHGEHRGRRGEERGTVHATVRGDVAVGTGGPFVTIVGAAVDSIREELMRFAAAGHNEIVATSPAFVIVKDNSGAQVLGFGSADDADDALGALDDHAFLYAALFDKSSPTYPYPVTERAGAQVHASAHQEHAIRRGAATVSGNMAVTEATIARQQQAANDAYYAEHGQPDVFGEVTRFVIDRAQHQVSGVPLLPLAAAAALGAGGALAFDRRAQIAARFRGTGK